LDLRGRDPRREETALLPLRPDGLARERVVPAPEGLGECLRRIADPVEPPGDLAVAVHAALVDLPVVGAREPRGARVGEDELRREALRLQALAPEAAHLPVERLDASVERGEVVLLAGRDL